MDKVSRRYNKVNKNGKIVKNVKKNKEKTVFEKLLVEFKQRKQTQPPTETANITGRFKVKPGIFGYGERSDIVLRNENSEDTEEVLSENLLKIIDLKKSNSKRKTNRVINFKSDGESVKFDSGIDFECSDEKSLFKELNNKSVNLKNSDNNENCLSFGRDEKVLIRNRLSQDMETSDIFREHAREILNFSSSSDYEQSSTIKIVNEQQKLNQSFTSNETITSNYKDTPISNTLKRKFIKRFNELTIAHNNGIPMTPEEAQQFVQMKEQESRQFQDIPNDQPQGCSTPINNMTPLNGTPIKEIFPEASFHTPENQKYVYKVPDTEVYQTCLYMVPDEQNKLLMKKVSQKENFVEVVMPRNVPGYMTKPALYELSKKDNFIFSPKIKKNFNLIEEPDKQALNKWSNKIKHVYECGRPITNKNQNLGENSVINLKKNLLFDDCDNVLTRPKKICKRKSSDDFKNLISLSPPLSDIDMNISKSEIRRKLNYSKDELSFEKENSPPSTFLPVSPCVLNDSFNKPKGFKGFAKPIFSPNEYELRKKYAPHTLTSFKDETKLQVVPISPSEYTKHSEKMELDTKNLLEFPDLPDTPEIKFLPRPL